MCFAQFGALRGERSDHPLRPRTSLARGAVKCKFPLTGNFVRRRQPSVANAGVQFRTPICNAPHFADRYASRPWPKKAHEVEAADENELVFERICAFADPPKPTVAAAMGRVPGVWRDEELLTKVMLPWLKRQ
jgi:hypothetical protein